MPGSYTLVRQPSTANGTLGEMFNPDGSRLCFTMELPWDDNTPDQSCIPDGTYNCVPHNSPAHPGTWQVENVPGRSEILIHTGNTEKDSLGCIIVGQTTGTLNGLPAVLLSKAALTEMQQTVPSSFALTISWASPLDQLRQA